VPLAVKRLFDEGYLTRIWSKGKWGGNASGLYNRVPGEESGGLLQAEGRDDESVTKPDDEDLNRLRRERSPADRLSVEDEDGIPQNYPGSSMNWNTDDLTFRDTAWLSLEFCLFMV
jgi:hypothetical protein